MPYNPLEEARDRLAESVTTTADRILETLLNGNRRDARDEFRAMTPGRAAAVAGYLVDSVTASPRVGNLSSVLRLLESCEES